jgi:hypothetical protein
VSLKLAALKLAALGLAGLQLAAFHCGGDGFAYSEGVGHDR